MELGDKNLEEWFLEKDHKFPKGILYKVRYNTIKLAAVEVQKRIHQGNIESENNKEKNQKTLTGHDPKHFEKVLKLVSELLKNGTIKLSCYEAFHLLCAIQVHDIGNVLDRESHQKTAITIFYEVLPQNAILDSVENNIFFLIAESHTQDSGDDKDTISKLGEHTIHHNDEVIRHHLLASILKLGDELADDPERAFMFGVQHNLVKNGSKLFHVYCDSLKSTRIDGKRILVSYKFDSATANDEWEFEGQKTYLLDYIFKRNVKMHLERLYCQKFMRPEIILDHIDVDIAIYAKGFVRKIHEIKYRILDKGYPELNGKGIKEICEDPEKQLKGPDGNFWSGLTLKNLLNAGQ